MTELEDLWQRVRLDPEADPPKPATLNRIRTLQDELARLLAEPGQLLSEVNREVEILVELHDSGARVDAEEVNKTIARARTRMDDESYGFMDLGGPMAQEEFDEWQQQQVERRNEEGRQ